MKHKVEKIKELKYKEFNVLAEDDIEINKIDNTCDVVFISFPPIKDLKADCEKYFNFICKLSSRLGNESKIVIYADYSVLPLLCFGIENTKTLYYKTWISIRQKLVSTENLLPNEIKGAVIFSKSNSTLNICKIKLPYTFCPACNRTTKDYGGKKHLFDEYGTTMSDVWKDISVLPCDSLPRDVIVRIRDMFSVEANNIMIALSLWDFNWNGYDRKEIKLPLHIDNKTEPALDSDITRNNLINGDVLKETAKIKTNSIDYIFVDPPYNLKKQYSGYHDGLEVEEYLSWCDKWLDECLRVLKPGKFLSILNLPVWSIRHYAYLMDKMIFCSWITWEALSRPAGNIMPAHYAILIFQKPSDNDSKTNINLKIDNSLLPMSDYYCLRESCIKKRNPENKLLSDLWTDIHRVKHNSRRYDHPCQLPPTLMKRLIAIYTNPGDTVLDCFNGVGTTTLCADILKRKYVGIEMVEQYHQVAIQRHNDIQNGLDPFRKNDIPAEKKTKNNEEKRIKSPHSHKNGLSKRKVQLMIKDLSKQLGRIPTLEDALDNIDVPESFYNEYFKNWGEVVAATKTTGMVERKSAGG